MLGGFTVQKHGLIRFLAGIPQEDDFATSSRDGYLMMTAADGVTRDCKNGEPLTPDLRGLVNARLHYPRHPDPAVVAVKLFINYALGDLMLQGVVDEVAIKRSFSVGNEHIGNWQRKNMPPIDYLANDFPGCVASIGVVDPQQGAFYWGQICDAGVALFDKDGNLKMRTENDGPDKHDSYIWKADEMTRLTWKEALARAHVRSIFRNNPFHEVHGPHTFGVLTGEPQALEYVHTGTADFRDGDSALVYTGGVEHILFSDGDVAGPVADVIRAGDWDGLKKLCRRGVKTEGTVAYAT